MDYVYIVYDVGVGLKGVFRTEERAKKKVLELVSTKVRLDTTSIPIDYNSFWRWGYRECYYQRECLYD